MPDSKKPALTPSEMGRKGGANSRKYMSPERAKILAKHAAAARHEKNKKKEQ